MTHLRTALINDEKSHDGDDDGDDDDDDGYSNDLMMGMFDRLISCTCTDSHYTMVLLEPPGDFFLLCEVDVTNPSN